MFWFFVKLVRFSSFKKIILCCDFFSHSKSILYFVFKFGFVFYLRGLPLPPTHPTGQEHTHTHTHNPMIFPWKSETPKLIFPEPGQFRPASRPFPSSQERKRPLLWVPMGPQRPLYHCLSPGVVFICSCLPQGRQRRLTAFLARPSPGPGPEQSLCTHAPSAGTPLTFQGLWYHFSLLILFPGNDWLLIHFRIPLSDILL